MLIPIYQVDAFAGALFRGNPAAVCPLERWLKDETLQAIAAENNLSETAYYVRENGRYQLRWFTPARGGGSVRPRHAGRRARDSGTPPGDRRRRRLRSIRAVASWWSRGKGIFTFWISLHAIRWNVRRTRSLFEALGARPAEFLRTGDCFCVFETEDQIRALAPDMSKLAAVDCRGVIVTAPGDRLRFCLALFRPARRHPGGSGDGQRAYQLDSVLVAEAGKKEAVRAADFAAGRRIMVRGPGRSRGDRRPGCKIPGGTHYGSFRMSVTTFRSEASERL